MTKLESAISIYKEGGLCIGIQCANCFLCIADAEEHSGYYTVIHKGKLLVADKTMCKYLDTTKPFTLGKVSIELLNDAALYIQENQAEALTLLL